MSEIKPNAELAYAVLDQIDLRPESWEQGIWHRETDCGTVACFAGWALELSPRATVQSPESGVDWTKKRITVNGETYGPDFENAACTVLGIEDDYVPGTRDCVCVRGECECEPFALFAAHNNREELGDYVLAIFGPRPTPDGTR